MLNASHKYTHVIFHHQSQKPIGFNYLFNIRYISKLQFKQFNNIVDFVWRCYLLYIIY